MRREPIFVHSLFRAGSTYVFQVFRRSSANYWCYQEPLHELLRHLADSPSQLLDIAAEAGLALRHPALSRPYFWEFTEVRSEVAPYFRKELSYDWFFADDASPAFAATARYFRALIENAKGTPLLQCCRTFGRVGALRAAFPGTHIHLWRNPWDQWWSYCISSYFLAAIQLTLNADSLPPLLDDIKRLCSVSDFRDRDVDVELQRAFASELTAVSSYRAFYALWLFAFLRTESACDLSINIDSLASSSTYRDEVLMKLAARGIESVDFADCSIPAAGFTSQEQAAFRTIEQETCELFVARGESISALNSVRQLRSRHDPTRKPPVEDAARARAVAVRQMNLLPLFQQRAARLDIDLASVRAIADAQQFALARAKEHGSLVETALARVQIHADRATTALTTAEVALEERAQTIASHEAALREANLQTATAEATARHLSQRLDAATVEIVQRERVIESLRDENANLRARWTMTEVERSNWHALAHRFGTDLSAIDASWSWRLTAPLRIANSGIRRASLAMRRHLGSIPAVIGALPRRTVISGWRAIQGYPRTKLAVTRAIARNPRLFQFLRNAAFSSAVSDPSAMPGARQRILRPELPRPSDVPWESHQSSSATRVYKELTRARFKDAAAAVKDIPPPT